MENLIISLLVPEVGFEKILLFGWSSGRLAAEVCVFP